MLIIRNDITNKVIVLGTMRINMHDIVSVWQRLFFPIYFSIQFILLLFIGPTTLFGTIHRLHCTISANFLVNLLFSRFRSLVSPIQFCTL